MGAQVSKGSPKPTVEGQWKGSFFTGEQFVTPDITSGPNVKKTPYAGGVGEQWGPYKKVYTKAIIGDPVFRPPGKVDGVPILCRCRLINEYMRGQVPGKAGHTTLNLGAEAALAVGSNRPACWEDSQTIMNPSGGDTFNVIIGHPAFYAYAANPDGTIGIAENLIEGKGLLGSIGLGGGARRSRRTSRKIRRQTRRRRRSNRD